MLKSTPRQELLNAIRTKAFVERFLPPGPDAHRRASSGLLFTEGWYDALHPSHVGEFHVARQPLAFMLALALLFSPYPQSLLAQDQQAQAQAAA
jgi:hypothetical protein